MENKNIKIANLADFPQWVETVAHRCQDQWNAKWWWAFESTLYRTQHALQIEWLPQTFIALFGNKAVGTVALRPTDLRCRMDLSPWLASLYVLPEYRKQGIGTLLQNHLLRSAKKSGFDQIFLCTELQWYYEHNGWKFMEMVPCANGEKVRVYKHKL